MVLHEEETSGRAEDPPLLPLPLLQPNLARSEGERKALHHLLPLPNVIRSEKLSHASGDRKQLRKRARHDADTLRTFFMNN